MYDHHHSYPSVNAGTNRVYFDGSGVHFIMGYSYFLVLKDDGIEMGLSKSRLDCFKLAGFETMNLQNIMEQGLVSLYRMSSLAYISKKILVLSLNIQ